MEGRTYLASDLANELELPRSTINDWLTRYADYLESETRGKRKVYSAKALRILREIAEMRTDGKSSFEIEQLLGARYGIRPEMAPPPPAAAAADGETLPATTQENALAARPAFDQMTVQINTEFMKLASRLEDAERTKRRLVQRMWIVTALMIVGVAVLLLVLALVMYQVLGRMEQKNREAAETLSRESGERFGEMNVVLDGSRQDFQENIAKLQAELVEQRQAFEVKLKEMEASSATRAEAQIIRFKEEFARRQQEELKRLEELQQTVRDNAAAQMAALKEEARRREEAAKAETARIEAERKAAEEAKAAAEKKAVEIKPEAEPVKPAPAETPKAEEAK